jgi:hypothetical protein
MNGLDFTAGLRQAKRVGLSRCVLSRRFFGRPWIRLSIFSRRLVEQNPRTKDEKPDSGSWWKLFSSGKYKRVLEILWRGRGQPRTEATLALKQMLAA